MNPQEVARRLYVEKSKEIMQRRLAGQKNHTRQSPMRDRIKSPMNTMKSTSAMKSTNMTKSMNVTDGNKGSVASQSPVASQGSYWKTGMMKFMDQRKKFAVNHTVANDKPDPDSAPIATDPAPVETETTPIVKTKRTYRKNTRKKN